VTLDLPALAELIQLRQPGTLFATVSGAHLYGFPSQDSDIDLRGCYLAPLASLVELRPPPDTAEATVHLAGVEVDLVSHEVGKYLRLMCKDNGLVLENIFSPLVVCGEEFLEKLRPLARRCVTRACYQHYRGFLSSRIQQLEKEAVKRVKTLLYAYRVALSGVHLLRTGEIQANLQELARHYPLQYLDELIARKRDAERLPLEEADWAWHREQLAGWQTRLEREYAGSRLPERAPWEEVEHFLVGLRMAEISSR
jgi:predicted nucleotidyltransferase